MIQWSRKFRAIQTHRRNRGSWWNFLYPYSNVHRPTRKERNGCYVRIPTNRRYGYYRRLHTVVYKSSLPYSQNRSNGSFLRLPRLSSVRSPGTLHPSYRWENPWHLHRQHGCNARRYHNGQKQTPDDHYWIPYYNWLSSWHYNWYLCYVSSYSYPGLPQLNLRNRYGWTVWTVPDLLRFSSKWYRQKYADSRSGYIRPGKSFSPETVCSDLSDETEYYTSDSSSEYYNLRYNWRTHL